MIERSQFQKCNCLANDSLFKLTYKATKSCVEILTTVVVFKDIAFILYHFDFTSASICHISESLWFN